MKKTIQERIDIYNVHRTFQNRTALRGEQLNSDDYYLVVQVWVKNSVGHFLIQKRADTVKSLPGVWATTAGVVIAGESSRTGAIRELREELGIEVAEHDLLQLRETVKGQTLGTIFLLEKDVATDEITLQADEVSQVKWATPEQIGRMVQAGTFYDYGADYFELLFQN